MWIFCVLWKTSCLKGYNIWSYLWLQLVALVTVSFLTAVPSDDKHSVSSRLANFSSKESDWRFSIAIKWRRKKKTPWHYFLNLFCVSLIYSAGIPRYRAGEVWKFLRSHMERRQASMLQPCPEYEHYSDLIKHLTTHQHAILIDLGTWTEPQ